MDSDCKHGATIDGVCSYCGVYVGDEEVEELTKKLAEAEARIRELEDDRDEWKRTAVSRWEAGEQFARERDYEVSRRDEARAIARELLAALKYQGDIARTAEALDKHRREDGCRETLACPYWVKSAGMMNRWDRALARVRPGVRRLLESWLTL